jgi:WD40 repeat protein
MQTFATASTDGALRVWDCESRLPVGSVALPKPAGSIVYSPDGMELLIGMGDSTIASVASAEVEGHRSVIIPSSLLDGRIAR